ncbi:MAG TPA: right-handed parallel beta-helix repeat-containing protein [Actinoplanes sp.]
MTRLRRSPAGEAGAHEAGETGAHVAEEGAHRAGWVLSGRRRLLAAVIVLVLLAGAAVFGYRELYSEGAPDVATAGPGYWVSTRGSDAATGTPGKPWRTVQHAIGAAPAGSKIFLRKGEYDPFVVSRPNLTIAGAPGERATIKGKTGVRDVVLIAATGVTVADLTVRGCVPKANADVNITGDHGSGIRVHQVSKVTISGVVVRDSHGTNAAGLPVGCHGILLTESRGVHVTGSEVLHNGAGIVVSRGGRGVLVENNDVHDQDVIVQNSAAANDDFGGYGLAATFITDSPGPTFRNNTVRRNHGPSTDYKVDGGGIELYDATGVTITGNTFETNDGVLETGTGGGGSCANNVFTGNTATGTGGWAGFDNDTGLVLRCAAGMVISGNTFTGLSKFTFLLSNDGDFAGKIDDLQITGNTVTRRAGTVVWRLQYEAEQPTGISVDRNTYVTGKDAFAVVDATWTETAVTYDVWRTRTGYDASSTVK